VNAVIATAAELEAYCQTQGWRFCIIGGLAVLRWGEPRETIDVDLTLLTGFGHEETYISALLGRFEGRIKDVAAFALRNRVLLLRAASGVGIDVSLGGLPFEQSVVDRASLFTYPPDTPLRTCSAEDLLVLKAFADRPKDWIDIDGVLIRYGASIDWQYVFTQLAPLAELKENPAIIERLESRRLQL
jgi:hypothetical protein